MATHNYIISFEDITGEDCSVRIGGGSGEYVAIKGAAEPFHIEEDQSPDPFTPVRTQSGYIRIVDDGKAADGVTTFDWHDLIPENDTSRPVKFEGGGLTWYGFMQAQDFGNSIYGSPQEREFPIQCCLSVLSTKQVSGASPYSLLSFNNILTNAFDGITTLDGNITMSFQDARSADRLSMMVDVQNFLEESESGLVGKYDYLQMVRDVCSLWGWSARMFGAQCHFTTPDQSGTTPSVTLGLNFANTKNEETIVRGYGKVTVGAEVNEADAAVVSPFPEDVVETMEGRAFGAGESMPDSDTYTHYSADLLSFNSTFLQGECAEGSGSFNVCYSDNNSSAPSSSPSNSLRNVVRLKDGLSQSAKISFNTVIPHSYIDLWYGGFTLSGKIFIMDESIVNEDDEGRGTYMMHMRLGVGTSRSEAVWWNGQEWADYSGQVGQEPSFKVMVGSNDGTWYSCYEAGTPPAITVRSYNERIWTIINKLKGLVFVEFLGSDDIFYYENILIPSSKVYGFDIENFKLEFHRHTIQDNNKLNSSKEYTAISGNPSREEYDCYLNYASDNNMKFGYGSILNSDGTPLYKENYGNNYTDFPEQHLANRIATFWSRSRRVLTLSLRSPLSSANITPTTIIAVPNISGSFVPIAIGHEAAAATTELTLLEIGGQ